MPSSASLVLPKATSSFSGQITCSNCSVNGYEFPPDVAERVGVTLAGGHLLPGNQRDPVPAAGGGQLPVVAHRVVVGDGDEVQPVPAGQPG